MAQYTKQFTGSFDRLLDYIDHSVMQGSGSASQEGGSNAELNGVRCAVRVYERYSVLGENRLSLSVTLFGRDDELYLTSVTAGGSQAMFFKINTWGEESFLNQFARKMEQYCP